MTTTHPTNRAFGPRTSLSRGARGLCFSLALELATIGLAALAFGPLNHQPTVTTIAVALLFGGLLAPVGGSIFAARHARSILSSRLGWLASVAALAQFAGLTWDTILHALGYTHFFVAHTLAEVGFVGLIAASLAYLLAERRGRG